MSFKKMLGLESLPLTDRAIMCKILEARKKGIEELEFPTRNGMIKVKINLTSYDGMMRDSWNHI